MQGFGLASSLSLGPTVSVTKFFEQSSPGEYENVIQFGSLMDPKVYMGSGKEGLPAPQAWEMWTGEVAAAVAAAALPEESASE